ncbi:BRCT domain-containing protein, partial [Crocosphaera watsonii]
QKDNGLEKEVQQQVKTITEEKQSLDNSLTQQEETISQEDNGLEQKQLTNNEKGEAISEVKSESAEVEESKEQVKSELVLKSKKLVIVGSLDSMNREKAKSLVQQVGGNLTSSPSSKTNYVVVGKNPGDKLKKAKKFGIAQLSETQFLEALAAAGVTEIN